MAIQQSWTYKFERLYDDQDPDFVVDAVAHLISWIDPKGAYSSHTFELKEAKQGASIDHVLTISWNVDLLAQRDPRLKSDLQRFRSGNTLTTEDQTKYAAYGLAMVALSCLLRRRVVNVSYYRPPDLLLDTTPQALRGVEVAGRGTRGWSAFAQTINGASGKPGKRAQLLARQDISEAYLSLWCRSPMVSIWEKVKP
jgi:hypothetical protein